MKTREKGFFDEDARLSELSKKSDFLEKLSSNIDSPEKRSDLPGFRIYIRRIIGYSFPGSSIRSGGERRVHEERQMQAVAHVQRHGPVAGEGTEKAELLVGRSLLSGNVCRIDESAFSVLYSDAMEQITDGGYLGETAAEALVFGQYGRKQAPGSANLNRSADFTPFLFSGESRL